MEFPKIKKAYFIGIKGAGMTALAQIFKCKGIEVSGSDTEEKFFTNDVLKKSGIEFFEGFNSNNVPMDADLIIYSTSYSIDNNAEVKKAEEEFLPLLSYPEGLGLLFNAFQDSIAVAGTHGKTTTSALLGVAAKSADLDPTVIVGSKAINFDANAICGKSKLFIAESDEYQNKFQYYDPRYLIILNVDYDHPDFFKTQEDYIKVFIDFIKKISEDGLLVVNFEDKQLLEISSNAKCKVITFGFSQGADFQGEIVKISADGQIFKVFKNNNLEGEFKIKMPGKHNILNALAVIAMLNHLGVRNNNIQKGIKEFKGTARRFEVKGEYNNALIIDDFAHHPSEIKATLAGARDMHKDKNIICLFHPHTYTRTQRLLDDFAASFADADEVIVLDIYGSAREQQGNVHSKDLVEKAKKRHNNISYIPTIEEAVKYLENKLGENDILITMGAGDVWRVGEELINF